MPLKGKHRATNGTFRKWIGNSGKAGCGAAKVFQNGSIASTRNDRAGHRRLKLRTVAAERGGGAEEVFQNESSCFDTKQSGRTLSCDAEGFSRHRISLLAPTNPSIIGCDRTAAH